MPNLVYSSNFAIPSAFVTNGTATGYDASRVGDYLHPAREWRSNQALSTSDYIGIDLGYAQTIYAVVVDCINVASVLVQYSSDGSSWTTEATATVSSDRHSNRYKLYQVVNSGSGRSARYWRVKANTGTATDGGPALRVGSIALLTSIYTMSVNPGFPLLATAQQAVAVLPMGGGGDEAASLGNQYARIEFNASVWPNASASLTDFFRLAGSIGQHAPMVIYLNNSDTSQVYICRRRGLVPLSYLSAGAVAFGSLAFDEVV